MKRKVTIYGLLALGCCIMASCMKNQEDYFDQSSSERLQGTMSQVKQLLRSSEYGWEFEYYPGSSLEYGGIVYVMRFDSLTVDVSCSLIPDSTETTYYRIGNDSGPVLTFDTYNRLFHYFSTPNSGEYEAKGGEFEFVVKELSDTLITLYGKKTRNTMYLRRLTAPADEYSAQTIEHFDHMPLNYSGTVGATEVQATISQGSKSLTLTFDGRSVSVPFAYNNKGVHLYRPVTLGGTTVQTLIYDKEANALVSDDADGQQLTLQGIEAASSVVRYSDYEGRYLLRYNGSSTRTVTLEPNRLDGSYQLKGLSPKLVLALTYDYETGNLTLGPQVVGDIGGATVYFVTFNSSEGKLWLADTASFTLKWNGNKNRVAYNFTPTNPTVYNCNSGVLVKVFYGDDGALTAAVITETEWLMGGSAILYDLNMLQKQK